MRLSMKNVRNQKLCACLIVVVSILLFSGQWIALSKEYKDIKGHWAEGTINEWIADGILTGYEDGTIRPNQSITRSEFITLVNRSFQFVEKSNIQFLDVSSEHWAIDEIAKAIRAGYIVGYADGRIGPDDAISRQEVAVIMTRLIPESKLYNEKVSGYADADLIPEWSEQAIGSVIKNELMIGVESDGEYRFQPTRPITRAEAITALDKALSYTLQFKEAGVFGPESGAETVKGDVIVSSPDVTLRNVIIEGDLTLDEAIGDGDLSLENIIVNGTTFVHGGGENSIFVNNSAFVTIEVNKRDGIVRIVVTGTTSADEVVILSSAKLESNPSEDGDGIERITLSESLPEGSEVILTGELKQIELLAENSLLHISDGAVDELIVSSDENTIRIDEGATIVQLILDAVATFSGEGTIENAEVSEDARNSEFGDITVENRKGDRDNRNTGSSSRSGSGGGSRDSGDTETVAVESVTIEPVDISELFVGDTLQLTATVEPADATDKNVAWSSSDEDVATVDRNGLVTAIAEGSVTITITSNSGNKTADLALAVKKEDSDPGPIQDESVTYKEPGVFGPESGKETVDRDVIISSPDVTLRNLIIEGDLTLDEAVGEGNVSLDNITVKGTTFVHGGGENSIFVRDSTFVTIEVNKRDGIVRIVATGSTSADFVMILSSAKLESHPSDDGVGLETITLSKSLPEGSEVILTGSMKRIEVLAEKALLRIADGAVDELGVFSDGNNIHIDEGMTILQLILDAVTTFTGEGKIENAEVSEDARNSDFGDITVENRTDDEDGDDGDTSPGDDTGGGSNGDSGSTTVAVESVMISTYVEDDLLVGATLQLNVTIEPSDATDQTVAWSSSDESVATIDRDGLVTAVAPGTVTLTVTTEDGNKQDTIAVTVKEDDSSEPVAVESVTISTYVEGDLLVGDTLRLNVKIEPSDATNQTVSWSSSDESVATVDSNGLVTAVSEGNVTITVTSNSGNKTDDLVLTVKKADDDPVPIPVESVTIAPVDSSELFVGEILQLTATVEPSDAANKTVVWSSSDESVATVDANGLVSAIAEGTATMTVTTEDGNKQDTIDVTVIEALVCQDVEGMKGNGTVDDPFQITNICQLQMMQDDLNAHYVLTDDIDATATQHWNEGKGFEPIGIDPKNPFTGALNGNGHKISGLYIHRPDESYIGLFGNTFKTRIENLVLQNIEISGSSQVGGLVGDHSESTILHVTIDGKVSGNGNVGGLVGYNSSSSISYSHTKGIVKGSGSHIGGLVGRNAMANGSYKPGSPIKHSSSEATVSGYSVIGGLLGSNSGTRTTISSSYSTGDVFGVEKIGGLIGENLTASIEDSYSTSNVTGTGNQIGGLIGYAEVHNVSITNSYSEGTVKGHDRVGGLVGYSYHGPKIRGSYSSSNVEGNNEVGGLVGATGRQTGMEVITEISTSYSTGLVSGKSQVGGLVGYNVNSEIKDSYSVSEVNGTGNEVGGLVGFSTSGSASRDTSSITNSYSLGPVSSAGSYVGGLIGRVQEKTYVTNSFSKSIVTGESHVGGFIGRHEASVETKNTYSTGKATGSNNVGGLIGSAWGPIEVISSYWNIDTSNQTDSARGEGKNDAEMKQKATFADWDFELIWFIDEGIDYPELRN